MRRRAPRGAPRDRCRRRCARRSRDQGPRRWLERILRRSARSAWARRNPRLCAGLGGHPRVVGATWCALPRDAAGQVLRRGLRTEAARREAHARAEDPGEVRLVVVTDRMGDVANRGRGVGEQSLSAVEPQLDDEFDRRQSRSPAARPRGARAPRGRTRPTAATSACARTRRTAGRRPPGRPADRAPPRRSPPAGALSAAPSSSAVRSTRATTCRSSPKSARMPGSRSPSGMIGAVRERSPSSSNALVVAPRT